MADNHGMTETQTLEIAAPETVVVPARFDTLPLDAKLLRAVRIQATRR